MLPCVCSVIDHRWRQNVIRTKKGARGDSRVYHWCSYRILTSSVIYYWTDARQHVIYLFYIITKQTTTVKVFFLISQYFNITQNPVFAPPLLTLANTKKKAIWRNLSSIQNEAISLVGIRSKQLWLVQESHATDKPVKLTAKVELNCQTYNFF